MYDRRVEGEELVFGNIGLIKGSLHIFDTKTRSWWNQLFGEAINGDQEGKKLRKVNSLMTSWKRWKSLHPQTTVYIKSSVPYHEQSDFSGEYIAGMATSGDGPLEATDLIVGVEGHEQARAFLIRHLAQERIVHETLDGVPIIAWLSEDNATASILDGAIDGKKLTFSVAENDQIRDEETGSVWDPITGTAVSGLMKGKTLQAYPTTYSLWFAWNKYRPDTELVAGNIPR